MTTKDKVKEALMTVMNEATNNYLREIKRAAWATVERTELGRIMLVQWPNDDAICVNYSSDEAGYGDLGTMVGSVSTEYFGLDGMIFLLTCIVDSYYVE